jgi:hypothetical protein
LSCAFLHLQSTLLATTSVRGSWVTDCSTFPTILVIEGDQGTGWSGIGRHEDWRVFRFSGVEAEERA